LPEKLQAALQEVEEVTQRAPSRERWERLKVMARSHRDPRLWIVSLPSLASAAPDPAELWDILVELFRASDVATLLLVGRHLEMLDAAGYAGLLAERLAEDRDVPSQIVAVQELERLVEQRADLAGPARSALAEPGLASRSAEIRVASAKALGRVGASSNRGRLQERVELDESSAVREVALQSLTAIEKRSPEEPVSIAR
jgi:hypothetical protein